MTTANLPSTVTQKLSALRQRVMLWFVVDGLGRTIVAIVAMFLVSFGLDRLFRMDLAQRTIVLLIMVGVIVWLLWRRIVNPLRHMPSDDALALQIESRHKELGDALITSMQLARVDDPQRLGASPALVAEAIRSGSAAAANVPFDDVVDHQRRNQVAVAGLAAVAVFALIIALFPGVMNTWAQRNLMLSPTVSWPQETELLIVGADDDGTITVPRGDDFRLKVEVKDGFVVPAIVHIDYRTESGGRATEQMGHVGERGFQATFRNVLEPFTFRIRGNDARTPRHRVVLVERPMPESFGVQVMPPDYTGKPAGELTWVTPPPAPEGEERPSGTDTFYVLDGSTLNVRGRSNKPIAEAYLVRGPETLRQIVVGEDQHTFDFQIRPDELQGGAYGIRMVDTDGLASRRPARFAVRVQPDNKPNVQAELIGIGDMITTVATIPAQLSVSDDFGVEALGLVHRHTGSLGTDNEIAPSDPQWVDLDQVADQLPTDRIEPFDYTFEAEPLNTPVGTHLTFHFAAVDNDAVGDGSKPGRRIPDAEADADATEAYQAEVAKVGRSTTFSLKVVKPETLRDELLRQEGEQRVEFDRLRKNQEGLRTDAIALRAELAEATAAGQPVEFTTDRTAALATLEKDQRLAARTCRAIRDRFEQIRLEYRNNKLEGDSQRVTRRLTESVIDPLGDLAERALPAAADQFDLARKTTLSPEDRLAALDEAIARQDQVIAQMEQILRAMVKMEGFQAAINLVREMIEAQEQVSELTEEEIERRVNDALEELERAFD